jgi:hypothetical protein
MIDLKKPLEGVPGLLLMAALVLFGATIGIAVAIGFTWIPMSGELANFLGGVVGAGLGAALAVMGAVYVQRRDARDRLTHPLNLFLTRAERLASDLGNLQTFLVNLEPTLERGADWGISGMLIDEAAKGAAALPDGAEFPRKIHSRAVRLKTGIVGLETFIDRYLESHSAGRATKQRHDMAMTMLSRWAREADELVAALRRF